MTDNDLALRLSDFLFVTLEDAKKFIGSSKKDMGRSAAEEILSKNSTANALTKEVSEERITMRDAVDKMK